MTPSDSTFDWLATYLDVRRLRELLDKAPEEVQRSFGTYIEEARFFQRVLDPDIAALTPKSLVLEIGSGVGLIARLIAHAGHTVTAFEPESIGFSHMHLISEMLTECWLVQRSPVSFVSEPFTEEALAGQLFDLVLAINVIEHVPNPAELIAAGSRSLASGGTGRFICPNYAFPYEPHFNMPTLVSKSLTRRLAARRIQRSKIVPEPETFWQDLSWPSCRRIRRSLRTENIDFQFSRVALVDYSLRLNDQAWLDRKGRFFKLLSVALGPIVRFGARTVPLSIAPIIDLKTSART